MPSEDHNSDRSPADEPPAPEGTTSHDIKIPQALRLFMEQGWAEPAPLAVAPSAAAPSRATRRARLAEHFPDDTLIIPTGTLRVRANDTDYRFRPASDFYWLTGDPEPDDVLVLAPSGARLFVPARSDRPSPRFYTDRRHGELWVGPRFGPEETAAALDIDTAPLEELEKALDGVSGTRVLRGLNRRVDELVATEDSRRDRELAAVLSELRLVKDDHEIAQLEAAVAATVLAFEDVVRALPDAIRHDRGERWIEGTFNRRARAEGNDVGYGSICACGPHATILHWERNDGRVRPDQLLLLDAGVESRELYTADVTRTLPIGGRWPATERSIYEAVLSAQRTAIAIVRPGAAFLDPHRAAMEVLAEALREWGILDVPVSLALSEDLEAEGAGVHRRWTLHGTSHMLGLDVHDCAAARNEHYRDGVLVEGMVLTIEPGLYFQPDDLRVPARFRGIGVRIEDDVVVTADGCRVLSAALPTDPDDIEEWMARLQADRGDQAG